MNPQQVGSDLILVDLKKLMQYEVLDEPIDLPWDTKRLCIGVLERASRDLEGSCNKHHQREAIAWFHEYFDEPSKPLKPEDYILSFRSLVHILDLGELELNFLEKKLSIAERIIWASSPEARIKAEQDMELHIRYVVRYRM